MGPAGRRCHARTAPVTPLVAFCLRPDLDPGPQLRQSPAAALLRPACRGGRAKVAGPASELATPALSRPGLAWSPPLCATSIRTGRHPDAPVWELLSAEGGCGSREGPGPQGRNSSFQPQRRPWPRPSPSRTVLSAVTRLRSLPQSREAHGGSPLSARKLAVFDTWSAVAVHIAMDNTVVMEDISKWQEDGSGRRGCGAAARRTPPPPPRGLAWGAGVVLEQGHPGQRLGDPWSSHGEDQARGGPGSPPAPRCFRVVEAWAARGRRPRALVRRRQRQEPGRAATSSRGVTCSGNVALFLFPEGSWKPEGSKHTKVLVQRGAGLGWRNSLS